MHYENVLLAIFGGLILSCLIEGLLIEMREIEVDVRCFIASTVLGFSSGKGSSGKDSISDVDNDVELLSAIAMVVKCCGFFFSSIGGFGSCLGVFF